MPWFARADTRQATRRARWFAQVVLILVATSALADDHVLEWQVYGDVAYSRYDYGPDQKSGVNGSPPDDRAVVDLAYFVTELEYFFTPELYFETEIEFEHGGSGAALELEYEEFGEFESDVEKGGEVRVEEFHVTRRFREWLNLRGGRFETAVGLLNRSHRPRDFFTTSRSEPEASIIPTTWDEIGVEAFGQVRLFEYRIQLVNGLDSSGFDSKFWVAEGHQKRFEQVSATDLAVVGRVDVRPGGGIVLGGSIYHGNTTQNRPKPDMGGIDGHLTIADVHADVRRSNVRGRLLALYGTLENADLISAKNRRLSSKLQVTRTPVAKAAFAWYAELGVDVLGLVGHREHGKLYPFVHYGRYDSMHRVDAGIFDEPRFEREVRVAGLNYFPHEEVVIKLDYSRRTFGSARLRRENTLSLDVGISTTILEL
jgi:opacity protein-like surface antigen